MKQFLTAFAALLATTATAMVSFQLETTFANEEEICIAVEPENPITLKLPRAKPPAHMCIECDGWQLKDDTAVYTDFTIVPMVVGKRTKFVITQINSSNMDGELVEFENTCNVDENGAILETKEILIKVFPFRGGP